MTIAQVLLAELCPARSDAALDAIGRTMLHRAVQAERAERYRFPGKTMTMRQRHAEKRIAAALS